MDSTLKPPLPHDLAQVGSQFLRAAVFDKSRPAFGTVEHVLHLIAALRSLRYFGLALEVGVFFSIVTQGVLSHLGHRNIALRHTMLKQ